MARVNSVVLNRLLPHDTDAEPSLIDERDAMLKLTAEMPKHLREVEAVARTVSGAARKALHTYAKAILSAVVELQRERLEIPHPKDAP